MRELIEQIKRLWHAGYDTQQIADILGVPESVIYNALGRIRYPMVKCA